MCAALVFIRLLYGRPPPFAWSFAQASRSVTVRLKTGRSGVPSGSAQK
jgi:hypothetical protein